MHLTGKLRLQIIDVAGGCAVAACSFGIIWLTLFREDRAAAEVQTLSAVIREAEQDARDLGAARDRQKQLLEKRRDQLARSGHLPAHAPVEEYFGVLAAMASQHRLQVVRQNPNHTQSAMVLRLLIFHLWGLP